MNPERERTPRCLGCLNFTGFSPLTPADGSWDPDQEFLDDVFTCQAFPDGIPEAVLGHRQAHFEPLPGQEGGYVYEPREPATLTCARVAGQLGCSASSVRRYLRSGLIWGVKRAGRWLICPEEVRLFRPPGSRRARIPPGFFRPA